MTSTSTDPIWKQSRAGQAIQDLNQMDRDIAKLLQMASSSIALLSLPQTDEPGTEESPQLPQGEERSEQFVDNANQYFEMLEEIQLKIRAAIATVRHYRINPAVIDASPPNFIPPSFGVALPSTNELAEENQTKTAGGDVNMEEAEADGKKKKQKKKNPMVDNAPVYDRGLQETKVERNSWKNLYELLVQMKEKRDNTATQDDSIMSS